MSSFLFPATLPGIQPNYLRNYEWNTGIQKAVTGKTSTLAYQIYPLVRFEYSFEFLKDSDTPADIKALVGLFNAVQGRFDTFLHTDPDFNSVTGQSFGTGNASTTAFQLVATYQNSGGPGQAEIIQNLNGTPSVFVNGVREYPTPLTSPSTPSLSQVSGGTIAARTNYVKTTYLSANGETLGSTEASYATSANYLLKVASPSTQTGAVSWNVYVSTSTGTETLQANVAIGTAWTEPSTGLVAGSALPAVNDTGWSIGATGIVTFNDAPANAAALTWTGSFYYRCRFDADHYDWKKIVPGFWSASKISFTEVLL